MAIQKLVSTYADDVARFAKKTLEKSGTLVDYQLSKALVGKKSINTSAFNRQRSLKGKIHYASGEILAMQNAKPQKITVQSTPTQQYIDNMLGIKSIDEAEHLARYKDLKYAFNHPNIGKAKPVITESRLTADVVEEMHNTKYIDALKKAEVTGELTEATKQRRAEILEAFETCEPRPVPPKKTLKDKIKTWFNRKQPEMTMTAAKSIARDYGVPGGHVPGWVALEKWAKRNQC